MEVFHFLLSIHLTPHVLTSLSTSTLFSSRSARSTNVRGESRPHGSIWTSNYSSCEHNWRGEEKSNRIIIGAWATKQRKVVKSNSRDYFKRVLPDSLRYQISRHQSHSPARDKLIQLQAFTSVQGLAEVCTSIQQMCSSNDGFLF